ncbi:MAG: outer membrane protein [Legionellales bacterium]
MNIKLFSAVLLASSIAHAATPVDGWYTSVFGGYTYLPDNVSATVNGLTYNGTSYNNGYNVGGRLGYKSNPIRYEAEYTYLTASNNGFNVNGISQIGVLTGNSSGNLLMVNLYYDCPEMLPAISPYLGIGIGYAFLQTNLASNVLNNEIFFSANESNFAYKASLGLSYNFSENYAATVTYQYSAVSKASNFGRVFQAQMANVGVVYRFDKGIYK